MKHHEFYSKYKTNYTPLVNPIFSRKNWRSVVLMTVVAVLIESLIISGRQRSSSFSFHYYFRLIEFLSLMMFSFVAFLFWANWRESKKRRSGYGWIGKFEVIDKQSTFMFCYLLLKPGSNNKLKVQRSLFEKIRMGDFVLIRRDVFGKIEEISRLDSFSVRVAKTIVKQFPKKIKHGQKQKV